jgi:hypothetical protein
MQNPGSDAGVLFGNNDVMFVTTRRMPTLALQRYAEEKICFRLRYPSYAQRGINIRSFVLTISKKLLARVGIRTDVSLLLAQSRIG